MAPTYGVQPRGGSVEIPILGGGLPLPADPSEPGMAGQRGEFGAVTGAGFPQHGTSVFFYRLDREDQVLGDELVGHPLLNQAAHLALPVGQGRPGLIFLQAAMELLEYGTGQDGLA